MKVLWALIIALNVYLVGSLIASFFKEPDTSCEDRGGTKVYVPIIIKGIPYPSYHCEYD